MSEIVENVNEQNSAQNNEEAVLSTATVVDVTPNNVDAAVKAVPEAVETNSPAIIRNADDPGSKDAVEKTSTSPKADNKKTPAKRTPSKRMSFIKRAQQESEELVKNMGGSLEIEGGRKTRSSTRGSASPAVSTPPPAKKARASPASGASTPTRPRGRGRKLDVADDAAEKEEDKPTPSKKKSPAKGKKSEAKEEADKDALEVAEEKTEEPKDDAKKQEEEKQESNLAADENKEKEETPGEDKTDAALDTVVEETQSQVLTAESQSPNKNATNEPESKTITADVVLEISESAKSDSPMDTDIEIVEEKCQGKQVVPETTLEAMDIDSSSGNDDDVVEINEDSDVVAEPTKSSESGQPKTKLNNIENYGSMFAEKFVVPPADVVANNSIEKPAAVAKPNEIISAEANFATNDTNKTENDLCEPKIATSPPIASSENSSATTPQTCN